mgnify:FL=1
MIMKNILFTLALLICFTGYGQTDRESTRDDYFMIKEMGGNGKKFWIRHSEIIDKSKSFSIESIVTKKHRNYFSSQMVLNSISKVLDDQNIITKDFVYENGEYTYVTDYLIVVSPTGFKIHKGDKEVLHVFVKSWDKSSRKITKQMSVIGVTFEYIFHLSGIELYRY